MQREIALDTESQTVRSQWQSALIQLATAWPALFALTFTEWRQMAHQWWDIDTYSHILLVPFIIVWLVWIRRDELAKLTPCPWLPGLGWLLLGLTVWLLGRMGGFNIIAQGGTIVALQGAVMALLGVRVALVLAFPLFFMFFLIPFGDEAVPTLQMITAHIAVALTHWSGVEAVSQGIHIDTPAGLFIVAEACSGVKFLIAMLTLGVLVAYTCFTSWSRRAWFMLACVVVPILANGIRAWATIFIAQYVGAEAAGSFDHIIYGWVFFGIVIVMVLGVAWRWFERDPEDTGLTVEQVDALPWVDRVSQSTMPANRVWVAAILFVIGFAVLGHLV